MRALVCLVVGCAGCLPSAFDSADRAERAREARSIQTDGHPNIAADSGVERDSATPLPGPTPVAPRAPQGEAGERAPVPVGSEADDTDAGAPPIAGTGAAGGGGAGAAAPSCGDNATDVHNCGSCGNDCSVSSALVSCVAGSCVRACVSTHADCNGDLSFGQRGDGCETGVTDDAKNCGGCNLRCDRAWGVVSTCSGRKCLAIAPSVGTPTPVTEVPHGPGPGGMPFEQQCGRNAVLIGIDVSATPDVLYGFAAVCAPLWLTGAPAQLTISPGDPQGFPMLGNNVVDPPAAQRLLCPSGAVVTSVAGTFWQYPFDAPLFTLKQLVLRCAHLELNAQRRVSAVPSGLVTAGSEPMAIEVFEDACPPDEAVVGLSGYAGALIDQLQTHCAPIAVAEQSTGSSVQAQD